MITWTLVLDPETKYPRSVIDAESGQTIATFPYQSVRKDPARYLAIARLICASPNLLGAADLLVEGPARAVNMDQLRGLNDLMVARDKARGLE